MKQKIFIYTILLLSIIAINCLAQEEDFCCERQIMFASVRMPAKQEYNTTDFLQANFYKGLNIWDNRYECPVKLAVYNIPQMDFTPENPTWTEDLE